MSAVGRHMRSVINKDPIQAPIKSASLSRAEREMKLLREENKKLRGELEDLRSLYNQLMKENSHECFDERRVMMLKAQVVQLERQVLLLSEALGSRSAILTEVENALCWLSDKFRTHIVKDIRGPEVNIQRSELTQMVERAESTRLKLFRNIENNTTENCSRPILLLSNFLQPKRQADPTLLDVASGSLEFLNLKEVGKLESSLCGLYKDLIKLHSLLEENDTDPRPAVASCHMTMTYRNRTSNQLLKCCAVIRDCCQGLMEVSLLHPSAPLPPLRKSPLKDITCEVVMKSLPSFSRSKDRDTQKTIDALLKAFSFKTYMLTQQVKALKEELKFHQAVYDIQIYYIESLFQAIRQGYQELEQSTNEVIVKPVKDILQTYYQLQNCTSESALRDFLTNFKKNEEQLQEAVDKLAVSSEQPSQGQEVISSFGEEFFKSLDKLVVQCQESRDRESSKRDDLRAEQEKLNRELQDILEEQAQVFATLKKPKLEGMEEIKMNTQFENINIDDSISAGEQLKVKKGRSSEKKQTDFENFESKKHTSESVLTEEKWISSKSDKEEKYSHSFPDPKLENLHKHSVSSKRKTKNETNPDILKNPKPKGYIPNTTVPKRTLQLKKSGSLPKIPWDSSGPEVIKDETAKQSENSS